MIFDNEKYGQLLLTTLPRVIDSGEEYDRIEAIFNNLFDKGEDNFSPEEEKLFELLANLLEDYEERTLPPLPASSPHEILRFLMKESDLKQRDLLDVFGSDGIASEVVNGKRAISKTHAKKLEERFKVSADLFI